MRTLLYYLPFHLVISVIAGNVQDLIPIFIAEMRAEKAIQGQMATLQCSVKDLAPPNRFAWVRYDIGRQRAATVLAFHDQVIIQDRRIRVGHPSETEWTLSIDPVRESDAGYYMCQLDTNPVKNVMGSLEVLAPPRFLNSAHALSDVEAERGDNVTLKCAATGNPAPNITWRRTDGRRIGDTPQENNPRGEVISLYHVRGRDMATYVCIVSNGIPPPISRSIEVRINFPPESVTYSSSVRNSLGFNATLSWVVKGYPLPDVHCWKGPTIIEANERYHLRKHVRRNNVLKFELAIITLKTRDFGVYKCIATNKLGDVDTIMELHEIPLPLTSTTASMVTSKHQNNFHDEKVEENELNINRDKSGSLVNGNQGNREKTPQGLTVPHSKSTDEASAASSVRVSSATQAFIATMVMLLFRIFIS